MSSLCASAQIKLEQNKTIEQKSQKTQYIEISNFGKYQANIIAFASLCKFSEDSIKIINDAYFMKLNQFNLTEPEKSDLAKEYKTEFEKVVDTHVGKTEQQLSCSKFKVEYDKIIEFLKKK